MTLSVAFQSVLRPAPAPVAQFRLDEIPALRLAKFWRQRYWRAVHQGEPEAALEALGCLRHFRGQWREAVRAK